MMDSSHYDWVASAANPGVHEKLLGVFTERRAQARMLKLDPGTSLRAEGRSIYFVYRGAGRLGHEPLRRFTAAYLDHAESALISASEVTELLHLGMPDLRGIAAQPTQAAVAAE
jgi:hypothetical protein